MYTFELNTTTHDLVIDNYNLVLIQNIDQLAQKIKVQLLFIYGEWFLDATLGVKYFELIWVKNPNLKLIESAIKASILAIDGVTHILAFKLDYNANTRILVVTGTVHTIYGTINIEEVL